MRQHRRDLLKRAVESGQIAAHEVRRDPNLAILMDPAQLAQLSA